MKIGLHLARVLSRYRAEPFRKTTFWMLAKLAKKMENYPVTEIADFLESEFRVLELYHTLPGVAGASAMAYQVSVLTFSSKEANSMATLIAYLSDQRAAQTIYRLIGEKPTSGAGAILGRRSKEEYFGWALYSLKPSKTAGIISQLFELDWATAKKVLTCLTLKKYFVAVLLAMHDSGTLYNVFNRLSKDIEAAEVSSVQGLVEGYKEEEEGRTNEEANRWLLSGLRGVNFLTEQERKKPADFHDTNDYQVFLADELLAAKLAAGVPFSNKYIIEVLLKLRQSLGEPSQRLHPQFTI